MLGSVSSWQRTFWRDDDGLSPRFDNSREDIAWSEWSRLLTGNHFCVIWLGEDQLNELNLAAAQVPLKYRSPVWSNVIEERIDKVFARLTGQHLSAHRVRWFSEIFFKRLLLYYYFLSRSSTVTTKPSLLTRPRRRSVSNTNELTVIEGKKSYR